jgi:hypothetical protein
MLKKIELTPEQLDYLLTMLTEHAEWIDPLSEEDRKLIGVLDNIAGQHPDMFAVVVKATKQRREEEHARHMEANKKAAK